MAFASLDDLSALGGLNVDWVAGDAKARRATRLLELAESTVVTYLSRFGATRAVITAGWDADRTNALIAIIAEVASKRLNVSAASSVDPYGTALGPQTIKLNRWEQQALRDLLATSAGGTTSVEVDRDPDTSYLSQLPCSYASLSDTWDDPSWTVLP
jgi:hypothetical protein